MVRFGAKKEESFLLFYFTKKGAKSSFSFLSIVVMIIYLATSKWFATTSQSMTLKKASI